MRRLTSPSDNPVEPVWKLIISLIEINMESPVIEEQLQELTYLYDIPKNLSEKIIIAIQNVTSADFGAFNRRFFVTVFVSANGGTISLLDRNWGLFRIERIGTLLESEQSQMRLVELYFYLEE